MPAFAAVVINDGATTPVAHTFSPVTTDGAASELADRTASTPAGFRKLQFSVAQPSGQRTAYQIAIGHYNPVEATVSGVTSVVRACSAKLSLNFAPDSTAQERKDTLAYLVNYLSNATVKTAIENIEPFY